MDPILVLAYFAIVLMVGILCTFVAKELKLPYNLILILLGMFLGSLFYSGNPLVVLDRNFTLGIGTLALVLLVFDSASRLRLKDNSLEAMPAINFINMFTLLSILVVSLFVSYAFFNSVTLTAILYSLLFSVMVVETDIASVLLLFKDFAKDKARHVLFFLETEANLNTAFVIILPFIVLSLMRNVDFQAESLLSAILAHAPEFFYEILVAIGLGIIIGIILLRAMQKWYDVHFTPIALITACLVAYVFTGLLKGNGIVAVAVMGFFYGNVYVQGKDQLVEFSRMLSSAIEIFVFVMLGIAIRLPISFEYVIMTILLFAVVVAVRLLAVFISMKDNVEFSWREKIFLGLNMPKGMALASVILVLSTYGVFGLDVILQLAVMIMIYSIMTSFVLDFYAHKIIVPEPVPSHAHQRINVLDQALNESLVEHKKPSKKKKSAKRSSKKASSKPKKKKGSSRKRKR